MKWGVSPTGLPTAVTAFFFLFLLVVAGTSALSPSDEASFYAPPGEKASAHEIFFNNSLFYLVVVNASPLALLEKSGEDYVPVLDELRLPEVLYSNAALVANATGGAVDDGVKAILNSSKRSDAAFGQRAFFKRAGKLNEFRREWGKLSQAFASVRKLSLPHGDTLLESMSSAVDSIKAAKTRDAQEGYARRFDEQHLKAVSLTRSYGSILPLYRNSSLFLANASKSVKTAFSRGLLLTDEAVARERELQSLEASLINAEALLVEGKEVASYVPSLLREISVNATRVAETVHAKEAALASSDDTLLYAGAGLVVLAIAGIAAFYYRKKLLAAAAEQGKSAGEEISAGIEKVLAKVREMEQGKER